MKLLSFSFYFYPNLSLSKNSAITAQTDKKNNSCNTSEIIKEHQEKTYEKIRGKTVNSKANKNRNITSKGKIEATWNPKNKENQEDIFKVIFLNKEVERNKSLKYIKIRPTKRTKKLQYFYILKYINYL